MNKGEAKGGDGSGAEGSFVNRPITVCFLILLLSLFGYGASFLMDDVPGYQTVVRLLVVALSILGVTVCAGAALIFDLGASPSISGLLEAVEFVMLSIVVAYPFNLGVAYWLAKRRGRG